MGAMEAIGSIFGVTGALLIASNTRCSSWAFPIYLVSNTSFVAFGISGGHWGIAASNAVFALIAIYGIRRWSK